MDKKDKLIVKLKRENRILKNQVEESERWEEYWKEKYQEYLSSHIVWKVLFFSTTIGSLLISMLTLIVK